MTPLTQWKVGGCLYRGTSLPARLPVSPMLPSLCPCFDHFKIFCWSSCTPGWGLVSKPSKTSFPIEVYCQGQTWSRLSATLLNCQNKVLMEIYFDKTEPNPTSNNLVTWSMFSPSAIPWPGFSNPSKVKFKRCKDSLLWWVLNPKIITGHFKWSGPPHDRQNHRFGWKSDMLYLWPIQIKNRKHDFWFLVPLRALRPPEISRFTQKCCQSGLPWWL